MMEPQTADQILKEFFKEPKKLDNKMKISKTRYITGTLTQLSKEALVIYMGYTEVSKAVFIKK